VSLPQLSLALRTEIFPSLSLRAFSLINLSLLSLIQ
jgi:hypothetical protein